MKKILYHAIVNMGTFDYILHGQANKAYAYALLSPGIRRHCSKSFFYKCLATRACALLKSKENYLRSAERYFDQISQKEDPSTAAPKLCAHLFLTYVESHEDADIRAIAKS